MAKAKFKLLNKWGNRVVFTDNEKEKNRLLDKGFHIDETWAQEEKPAPIIASKTRRKAVKKNERKTED